MLPERLAAALALIATVAICYLALTHRWNFETTMVAILLGVLAATLIGRYAGTLSGRELAKGVRDDPSGSDDGAAPRHPGA